MKLKVVELFAGVGGFRVGLNNIDAIDKNKAAIENGKWEFVWANQFEPSVKTQHAFNCYKTRFPNCNVSNEDINKVDKNTIPHHSLLVGGFPCQDYSVAKSLSSSHGIEGKKGVLFWDIKDVLLIKQTPFILLENVDRLLKSPSTNRGRDFAIMLKTFDELGYNVQWRVIDASNYSMPQKRKRIFIFAYKNTSKYAKTSTYDNNIFNEVFPCVYDSISHFLDIRQFKNTLEITQNYNMGSFLDSGSMVDGKVKHNKIKAVIENIFTLEQIIKNSKSYNANIQDYVVPKDKLEKWKVLKSAKKKTRITNSGFEYTYSEGNMAFPDDLTKSARTMLTSEGSINRSSHIIYDKDIQNYRILTPIECELIQMFPPNWTDILPNRARYFMMGNALVTGIVKRLEPKLREIIENE